MSIPQDKGKVAVDGDAQCPQDGYSHLRQRFATEHGAQLIEDTKGHLTLRRGLKARQISMIAVSEHSVFTNQDQDTLNTLHTAWWCTWHRYSHFVSFSMWPSVEI